MTRNKDTIKLRARMYSFLGIGAKVVDIYAFVANVTEAKGYKIVSYESGYKKLGFSRVLLPKTYVLKEDVYHLEQHSSHMFYTPLSKEELSEEEFAQMCTDFVIKKVQYKKDAQQVIIDRIDSQLEYLKAHKG